MFPTLVLYGLLYGLGLSVLLSALFIGGASLSPDVMLRGYPPDIKAKYGPISVRGAKVRRPMALLLFVILFGTVIAALSHLAQITPLTFVTAFMGTFIVLLTFNLVDLVILDWLIFVTLQPRFFILPGTEGLAGYKDYAFHFKAFLRGVVLCLIASAVVAGVAALIAAL